MKERRDNMTREEFRKTGWKMGFEIKGEETK